MLIQILMTISIESGISDISRSFKCLVDSLPLCDSISAFKFAYVLLDIKPLSLQNEDRALKYVDDTISLFEGRLR